MSLPPETRQLVQSFVHDHEGLLDEEELEKVDLALKEFWKQHVGENKFKAGLFVGVLRELQPMLVRVSDIWRWWQLAIRPVLFNPEYNAAALEDAQEFLRSCVVGVDEDENHEKYSALQNILRDLLRTYCTCTQGLNEDEKVSIQDNELVAQQVENAVLIIGRKYPKGLFNSLDDLLISASTRLPGLTLLNNFLRHQTPHLYLVIHTPLIEHLLKCLMNDLCTTTLSLALTSLIMLLPHVPGSLVPHLPRLFLVYSRLLCWEKFSPLSTESKRNLVTDDRVSASSERDHSDVGIDRSWEKVQPEEGFNDDATPELMTYFTYLYGLYPLNFTSYIRKPRRYLKDMNFLGANDFDLDSAVIHDRTEQFRQVHLMHPNFYRMTAEEELTDPKWPKEDPADVVAACHSLWINTSAALISPVPPPKGGLPEIPSMNQSAHRGNAPISPSVSHVSLRSINSWRETQSVFADSSGVPPHDDTHVAHTTYAQSTGGNKQVASHKPNVFAVSTETCSTCNTRDKGENQTNLVYLHHENMILKNELNFERWHKAQYSQHISQLMRKHIKDATVEAETLNLINANRALERQLEQVRNAREATIKDSALARKQANSLEASLTSRINAMRKEQETWREDAEELERLRKENSKYRDLLVASEARETIKSHDLEIIKRDLEKLRELQAQLHSTQRQLRQYEYRAFEMNQAKRELEIVQHEKQTLLATLRRQEHDNARMRRVYEEKIAELQKSQNSHDSNLSDYSIHNLPESQTLSECPATIEWQNKFAQLKRKNTTLMERYTDLEIEFDSMKEQLNAVEIGRQEKTFFRDASEDYTYPIALKSFGSGDTAEAMQNDGSQSTCYTARDHSPSAFSKNAMVISSSDPSSRHFRPSRLEGAKSVSPSGSEEIVHGRAGLTWTSSFSRPASIASHESGNIPFGYNKTAPLSADEMSVSTKDAYNESIRDVKKLNTIQPESKVRVSGRGGVQNIKMKSRDKEGAEKSDKKVGMKGFRHLI